MLSNSTGLGTSAVQGGRRTDAGRLLQVCPHLKKRGRCPAYKKEQHIRHEIAIAKEKELVAKATAMYTLQLDLLASVTDEVSSSNGDMAEAQALLRSLSARGVFSPEATKKKDMIHRLVEELKQEPAYQHWNLEAELAAEMVRQRVRHCPFSHQEASQHVLKRDRAQAERVDAEAEAHLWKQLRREGDANPQAGSRTASDAVAPATTRSQRDRLAAARGQWAHERVRVFTQLTPFQKCVCMLLWQQSVRVPQRLLKDVRRALEREVEQGGEWPGKATPRHKKNKVDEDEDEAAMEAYLTSEAFDARVEAEEARQVTHVVCRPELGVLDLSSLPNLVVYASERAGRNMISAETIAYFTTAPDAQNTGGDTAKAASLAMRTWMPSPLTNKEVDLSHVGKANEFAEALEWMGVVFNRERRLSRGDLSRSTKPTVLTPADDARLVWRSLTLCRAELSQAEALVTALHKRGLERHLLALDLSDNRLTSLRFLFYLRAHYGQRLLRLSLRNNLITRKPEYQEQVRLSLPKLTSLDGEPIRRPPMPFPRPRPDSFSLSVAEVPDASSLTSPASPQSDARTVLASGMTDGEARSVLDCLARLCYIWETRRIPHTHAELARYTGGRAPMPSPAHRSGDDGVAADEERGHSGAAKSAGRASSKVASHLRTVTTGERQQAQRPQTSSGPVGPAASAAHKESAEEAGAAWEVREPEQDLDEDNFPHRYLHPSATYSFSASTDLVLFDASTMKLNREVELDETYQGMRLNHDDHRAVRVFDVALRNSSRNILHGRPALQRTVRGAANCYLAYQLTLYPESLSVDHHLDSAIISVVKVRDGRGRTSDAGGTARKASAAAGFGAGSAQSTQPTFYLVTVHSVLTWRAPSMRGTERLTAAYDRTVTFVEKVFPAQNREWERLRSPKLVVYNDHIHLRPHRTGEPVCYTPITFSRLARLVVEFGLEACVDGVELVRCVMEQARTDAAEHAALDALVFGPPPSLPPLLEEDAAAAEARSRKEKAGRLLARTFDRASAEAAQTAIAALMEVWVARTSAGGSASTSGDADRTHVFQITSLLDRTAGEAREDEETDHRVSRGACAGQAARSWGGSRPHAVSLAMVREVVAMCNAHYAALKLC